MVPMRTSADIISHQPTKYRFVVHGFPPVLFLSPSGLRNYAINKGQTLREITNREIHLGKRLRIVWKARTDVHVSHIDLRDLSEQYFCLRT